MVAPLTTGSGTTLSEYSAICTGMTRWHSISRIKATTCLIAGRYVHPGSEYEPSMVFSCGKGWCGWLGHGQDQAEGVISRERTLASRSKVRFAVCVELAVRLCNCSQPTAVLMHTCIPSRYIHRLFCTGNLSSFLIAKINSLSGNELARGTRH